MGVIRKIKKVEYYDSIESLPIYNWFKINETNDLRWIAKDFSINKDKSMEVLLTAWNKIFDEFIDTFGIPEKLLEIMQLKNDIFILKSQMALSGDRSRETFIEIKQEKLDKMLAKDKDNNVNRAKVYVEKFMGFKLDQKTTTVKEFYEYIQALNDHVKHGRG